MATLVTIGTDLEQGPITFNLSQVAFIEWYGMMGDGDKTDRQPTGAKISFAFDDNTSSRDHIELDENYAPLLWQLTQKLDVSKGTKVF